MEPSDVAHILRDLAEYLRKNPNQVYQVSIEMTGVSVQASAPGATGFQATAIGGPGGGTVIGADIRPQFGEVSSP